MSRMHDNEDHRFDVEWALADQATEPEQVVVDLTDPRVDLARDEHCPACRSPLMESTLTPDGDRLECCLSCGRVWKVEGEVLRLVLDAEVRLQPE